MSVIINGTAGVTYPDSTTQFYGIPAPGSNGNVLTSTGTAWASSSAPSSFPSGTITIFKQTAAPTGWTKDTTTNNDSALRCVTGTPATGGTVGFTTAFASQAVSGTIGTSGAYTLATANIPAHTHTAQGASFNAGYAAGSVAVDRATQTSSSTGGGGSHSHSGGSFTGTAINLAVKYVDVIVATKN
jgi:hypothetical protein